MPALPRATDRPAWADQLDEWHLLTPVRVLIVLVLALVLTLLARRYIGRIVGGLANVSERTTLVVDRERSAARSRTVSLVLRSALVGVIWTTAALVVLAEVGINIGAFVAVATVIGGAIGFGAQQAVRDYLAGFFMISEDQLGIGDVVEIGMGGTSVVGTVESVTLRVVCVRDGVGVLWWIPNGQITRIGNRNWSAAVLDVRLPASCDLLAARAVLEAMAQEVAAGSDEVTGPPVVDGPVDLDAGTVVLRVSLRTTPGQGAAPLVALRAAVHQAQRDGSLPPPATA